MDKIEIQCPRCKKVREVNPYAFNRPCFTGFCQHCWGIVNSNGSRSEIQRKRIAQSLVKHTEIAGNDTQSAGCKSIHKSLRLWHGKPTYCENDPSHIAVNGRYERVNIVGVYTRNIEDYASLCPTCHKRYDANKIKFRGLFKTERMVLNGI